MESELSPRLSLSKLCSKDTLEKIKEAVEGLDDGVLADRLALRSGVFGYSPLHEAVASRKPEVLDYLLTRTGDAHVDYRANGGNTPLHLAASRGSIDCIRVLLRHGADYTLTNEDGKTPKQVAESISILRPVRSRVMRLLRLNEGSY